MEATTVSRGNGKWQERLKAVETAVASIERQFGKGSIMALGDDSVIEPIAAIPTGSLALDVALGIGGFPRGRVVEIFGPESSGKTTLALHAIASAQKLGGVAAFVDAEHALDVRYAAGIGVQIDKLYLSQPDTGEQALEIVEILCRSGGVDLIVIDSVAALTPRAEIEGEMGDQHVGLQARLMSQALRKLTAVTHRTGTCLVFLNQIRMKIGVMFGSPETTTGGNALKFYASARLDVRRTQTVKDGDVAVASATRVKVVKNKVARPFTEAEFEIRYGTGIDAVGELLELGSANGVVEKSGAWFAYGGERLGQGKEKAGAALRENPAVRAEIEEKLREVLGLPAPVAPAAAAEAEA
jgi:recombination protein RecA